VCQCLTRIRSSAARLVGGDTSNNPIVHPIRWPGSWHRKATPRLCEIIIAEPDVEIALTDAIAALPPPRQAHTTENWLTFLDGTYEDSQRVPAIRRYAGLLVRADSIDPLIIKSTVRLFNAQGCIPPLPLDEVDRIVDEIFQRHADQLDKGPPS
jgi:hypothetical protein